MEINESGLVITKMICDGHVMAVYGPGILESIAADRAQRAVMQVEADKEENGGPISIAGRKIGPYTMREAIVPMSCYHSNVKAWMEAKPCPWERFLSECKAHLGNEWHKVDEFGSYDIFPDCDDGVEVDSIKVMEENFLKNVKALHALPFPKEVVLAVASTLDPVSVPGVCSICCHTQERYKKLTGGKELPSVE